MGDLRNRLDRKSELRLYEWMKSADNFGKLSNKTIPEGAALVSQELDLKVSSSVLVSLVQAMELEPFWKQKPAREQRPQHQGTLDFDPVTVLMPAVQQAMTPLQEKINTQGKRLDHQQKNLVQLKAVCQNLMLRLESIEGSAGSGGTGRKRKPLNGSEGEGKQANA